MQLQDFEISLGQQCPKSTNPKSKFIPSVKISKKLHTQNKKRKQIYQKAN